MTTRRWGITNTRGGAAARIVTTIGAILALIEVVYILINVFGVNKSNGFYVFVQSIAEPLALFFPGLFTFVNKTWETIVNYGLAAVFWLLVAGLIARIVAR